MYAYPIGTFPYVIQVYDNLWQLAQRYDTSLDAIAFLNPGMDMGSLRIGQVIYICPGFKGYTSESYKNKPAISKAELELRNNLRLLWEQHVIWTRMAILSIVFGLPDAEPVTNRLIRNPKDFEAALKTLYGERNAARFADLLKEHLLIAAQLVKAAKSDDKKAAAETEKRWYANADTIAAFLGSINPYWSVENWRTMLYKHLSLTKKEALDMITKNYSAGIDTFDEIEKQALEMAHVMSDGILMQFPDRFK